MKKLILFLLVLFSAAGMYLWDKGKDFHEVRTEIDIAASPEKVWAILADINSWQEWSPIINHSSGDASMGSTLSIIMIGEKEYQSGPEYNPIITHLEAPKALHWRAVMMMGVGLTNDKIIELEATPAGTRVVHKELFKGMLLPMFRGTFDRNVPLMLNVMNEALKLRAEKD